MCVGVGVQFLYGYVILVTKMNKNEILTLNT